MSSPSARALAMAHMFFKASFKPIPPFFGVSTMATLSFYAAMVSAFSADMAAKAFALVVALMSQATFAHMAA